MTTFYTLAARLSGIAAVVCAVLAVAAYPGSAQADTGSDCIKTCQEAGNSGMMLNICAAQCVQQGGLVACSAVGCDDGFGACKSSCANKSCNEGGKNPATAKCASVTAGCRCQ